MDITEDFFRYYHLVFECEKNIEYPKYYASLLDACNKINPRLNYLDTAGQLNKEVIDKLKNQLSTLNKDSAWLVNQIKEYMKNQTYGEYKHSFSFKKIVGRERIFQTNLIMAELEKHGIFVHYFDYQRHWYRYNIYPTNKVHIEVSTYKNFIARELAAIYHLNADHYKFEKLLDEAFEICNRRNKRSIQKSIMERIYRYVPCVYGYASEKDREDWLNGYDEYSKYFCYSWMFHENELR